MAGNARTINGYRILRKIMLGRHSVIYHCTHVESGNQFAIKTLQRRAKRVASYRKQLKKESRIGLELDHPNIIKVCASGEEEGNPYYVMEFFSGKNLKQMIRYRDATVDRFLKSIILQTAEGLEYLHSRNLVHRDMKPDNVLVDGSGKVKLIDFGLTGPPDYTQRKSWWGSLFRRRTVQGTRLYMSPEQILGHGLDFRSDIYSLGVTIYELVLRKTPFVPLDKDIILYQHLKESPPRLRSRNPAVTKELDELVMQMLEKDPKRRPAGMSRVLGVLRGVEIFETG